MTDRMQPDTAGAPTSADLTSGGPIVLFDGVCNLCNGAVRFVIERDPTAKVRFASLQSEVGRQLLAQHGAAQANQEAPESMLLLEDGLLFGRSTAALKLAGHMRAPWPLLRAALLVPRGLRDGVYDLVSRRRYRWFGRADACRLPTPEEAQRFLG